MQQGYITGDLKTGFSAEQITDRDNFICLLYYFGMSTLDGTMEGDVKLSIPYQVKRKQMYSYIIELKYAKSSDSAKHVEELQQKGILQANRYAATEVVRHHINHTQPHKLIVAFHGVDIAVYEEIP